MLMSLDLLAGITSDPYVTPQEIHQAHFIKLKKTHPLNPEIKRL